MRAEYQRNDCLPVIENTKRCGSSFEVSTDKFKVFEKCSHSANLSFTFLKKKFTVLS